MRFLDQTWIRQLGITEKLTSTALSFSVAVASVLLTRVQFPESSQ